MLLDLEYLEWRLLWRALENELIVYGYAYCYIVLLMLLVEFTRLMTVYQVRQ